MARVFPVDGPSRTSLRREQQDTAVGPLLFDVRSNMQFAVGQLPDSCLVDKAFAQVVQFLGDDTGVDQATMEAARMLCSIDAATYMNQVGSTYGVEH